MALGQIYNTGTVTVTNGSTTVTGAGVIWNDVIDGDTLQVGATQSFVASVNAGLNVITLKAPWAGATAAGATYLILKNSWQRYDPSITQSWVRDLLAKLNGAGIIYAVTGTPDPGIGNDGDYALRTTTPSWTLWLKVAGTWVIQGDIREPFDTRKNVVINGRGEVNQRGTTEVPVTNGVTAYPVDCWEAQCSHIANTANIGTSQLVGGGVPESNTSVYLFVSGSAITPLANTDYIALRTKIEGYRIEHFRWGIGAGLGKPVMVAFWARASITGTTFVKLSNSDRTRTYYHEITIAAAGVWQYFVFAVPPDDAGTWVINNGIGLRFELFGAGKDAAPATVLDAWGSINRVQTTNSINFMATFGNILNISSLLISVGTQLPAANELGNLMRPYNEELSLCQRYFRSETYTGGGSWMYVIDPSAGYRRRTFIFNPYMRVAPTITFTAIAGSGTFTTTPSVGSITPYSCELIGDITTAAGWVYINSIVASARL